MADIWLVPSEEPVATDLSCSVWPLAGQPSQREACDWLPGYRRLPLKWVTNGDPWGRWHQSRHTSQGGTQSSHPTSRGCHPISWSLLQNLAPRHRGSRLRDSHTPTAWFWIATEATKPYSCCHLMQLKQVYHLRPKQLFSPGGSACRPDATS